MKNKERDLDNLIKAADDYMQYFELAQGVHERQGNLEARRKKLKGLIETCKKYQL